MMTMANNNSGVTGTLQMSQPHAADTDPIAKYQTLLPILKESVTNLIRHTVYILQNTTIGQCKQSDIQMLNKCVEDFNNISVQIYHWLNLADKTVAHYQLGNKFSDDIATNAPVVMATLNTTNTSSDQSSTKTPLTYTRYLTNAKRQVKAVQELRNMLTDFADGLATDSNI